VSLNHWRRVELTSLAPAVTRKSRFVALSCVGQHRTIAALPFERSSGWPQYERTSPLHAGERKTDRPLLFVPFPLLRPETTDDKFGCLYEQAFRAETGGKDGVFGGSSIERVVYAPSKGFSKPPRMK
jgi:hypothetical protein